VLVRVDFNVPLKDGAVADDTRIAAALPTIKLLKERGAAQIVLLTHLGRPGGIADPRYDLAPVKERLAALVDMQGIELLPNLRFDPREEAGEEAFARELAARGDVYVNEAFPVSHRADASVVALPKLLPHYAGLRFIEEVSRIGAALQPPQGSIAVIGGAKFETKEPLIQKLLGTYAQVLLDGALGNDVIKARDWPIGASLISQGSVPVDIASDERLQVASDAVVRDEHAQAERTTLVVDTQDSEAIVDIGPTTARDWAARVSQAPFVLWNGPLGVYEQGFSDGTDVVAQSLVAAGTPAVIGGGDTIAAVSKSSFDPSKVFLSTGGGAMLEYLVLGTLPGIVALKN
jgi:phosphoglycerate kinase